MTFTTKVSDLSAAAAATRPDALYEVYRNDQKSESLATYPEVLDFLDACGIKDGDARIEPILRGVPFEIDGGTVRFAYVENPTETPNNE